MAVSVTLALTSFVYCGFAGYLTLKLKGLFTNSKAPYSIILALGIVLQFVVYVLFLLNFIFLAFLPRRRRVPLLGIISASLFRFIPVLLIVCTVRALHARLYALKAAQPARQKGRFRLVWYLDWLQVLLLLATWIFLTITSRTVSDAVNGRRAEHDDHRPPILSQVGELVHALIFTTSAYIMLVFSRRMNGFLLLPDKVLLALNTRITPVFLFRSSYTVLDAILPLVHPRIRILTPSLTISADGFIWLVIFYNLAILTRPEENWIGQEAAGRVRGLEAPSPTPALREDEDPPRKATGWSRLLSPFHRNYGATTSDNGNADATERGLNQDGEETAPAQVEDGRGQRDVAIVHGVSAGGTQVYAQTGPMAPAWLLQDVAVNGKAGTGPIPSNGN